MNKIDFGDVDRLLKIKSTPLHLSYKSLGKSMWVKNTWKKDQGNLGSKTGNWHCTLYNNSYRVYTKIIHGAPVTVFEYINKVIII